MIKKTNNRTCIISRTKTEKNNLIRLTIHENEIIIDNNNSFKHRGFYILKDKSLILKLKKSDLLLKRFKIITKDEIFDEMLKTCEVIYEEKKK